MEIFVAPDLSLGRARILRRLMSFCPEIVDNASLIFLNP
jgi:hypothetical protein